MIVFLKGGETMAWYWWLVIVIFVITASVVKLKIMKSYKNKNKKSDYDE